MILFKGKKAKIGSVYTMDITIKHIWAVFCPKDFHEKYKYLGVVPWDKKGNIFKAMEPLVVFMDYKAKPWWCPRFILRLLHLFGMDNSIVRMRNRFLCNLSQKITGGYMINDYKTKWEDYDLRISIFGTNQMQDLADAIESKFYDDGHREDLADQIKKLDPDTKYNKGYLPETLKKELNRLEELLIF